MAKNKQPIPIKAIVALCEGKTDVAFLRRVLAIDRYTDYKEIVSDIPRPLGLRGSKGESYFSMKLKSYNYDSSKLRDRPILPLILRRTFGQSNTYLLLYDMNGMGRIDNYKEIISDFQKLSAKGLTGDDYENSIPKIDVSLAFIYDLDDQTKADRVQYIKNTFGGLIKELEHLNEEKNIIDTMYFKALGYHFLPDNDTKGNLEDVILPLMRKGNDDLFLGGESFLNCEKEFIRYKESNKAEKDENKTNSDFKKSLIGAVGQIENSGLNNADIIKSSSLLNTDKLNNSPECQKIISFIKALREKL